MTATLDPATPLYLQTIAREGGTMRIRVLSIWVIAGFLNYGAILPLYAQQAQTSEDSAGEIQQWILQLKDPDANLRWDAVRALGFSDDPRAVDPAIAMLKDSNEEVRWAAARALWMLRDPRAVMPLIAALRDPGMFVRSEAANALGILGDCQVGVVPGDSRLVDSLIALLHDPILIVRRKALFALAKIGDSKAIDPLREALRNKENQLIESSLLREIYWLEKAFYEREGPFRFFFRGAQGNRGWAGDLFRRVRELDDSDKAVRINAIREIEKIGSPRAVFPLLEALETDPEREVRAEAARVLGELGDVQAAYPLSGLLSVKYKPTEYDPQVRASIEKALGALRVVLDRLKEE